MTGSPYPGLRPFREDEADLFFGREEQIEGLLEKLGGHRFLAVVGPSGCGKSSLVTAGMLPALKNGFLIPAGEHWRVATLRPGESPIQHLAQALYQALYPGTAKADAVADPMAETFLAASLRRGPLGIVEVFKEVRLPEETNLLVLVDQFEELFRYLKETDGDEAEGFVNLLLGAVDAAGTKNVRVYVALTMRSDFLGECARFPGLPEAMNDSQFLTPRLTREQRRAAVTGPAGLSGGSVEPVLVNRLLNDMGSDPDQLPLMQHCLMRMWTNAAEAGKQGRMTLEGYEAVGGVENALSDHADIAYEALSEDRKQIAEVLFKCLTERGEGERDTRRPVTLGEAADVAGVGVGGAGAVAHEFRKGNRNFLTLSGSAQDKGTMVDISHESLIRQWGRLRQWVQDEARSAETYRRLETSAQLHNKGEEALQIPPGLDVALNWKDKENPKNKWAKRYGGDFDLAMTYLEESRQAQAAKVEEKEKEEQKKLNRTRMQLMAAVFGLFIALGLAAWGFCERDRADRAKERAEQTEQIRTHELFESLLTHASLQAKNEDYDQAREVIKKGRGLDKDISPERRHARNLMAWYTDLMGGQADKIYEGAGAQLQEVAISPDGNTLAAVGERGTVVLFDEAGGKIIQQLEGHNAFGREPETSVRGVVFHPKGKWLATAGDDKRIILWYLPQGEKLREWEAPDKVRALALNPDGTILASGGTDNAVTLWNPETGEKQSTLQWHDRAVAGLTFSPDGTLLASAAYDHTVRIWEVGSGKVPQVLQGHANRVQHVTFHPDRDWLASSSDDKSIIIWDAATGRPVNLLRGHENYVPDLQFIDGGRRLASVSMDRTLRIWDTETGVTLRVLQGHTASVTSLAPHSNTLYSAANDGTVRRWQTGIKGDFGGMAVKDLPGKLKSTAIASDGSKIAVGFNEGELRMYALPDFKLIWEDPEAHDSNTKRVAFSPDGTRLVTGSFDNTVKLWQSNDGKLLKTFNGHTDAVHAVAFSPDGKTIASAGYDGRIGLFNINEEEGVFFKAHEGHVNSIAFDGTGQNLLSAGDDGATCLWDIRPQPPEELTAFPKSNEMIMWAAFSPDGTRIAAVGRDYAVRIFNTRTGREENVFVGHEQAVYRGEFSPDGGQVATASSDATIRFWDLETGSALFTINLPSSKSPPVPLWDFSFRCTPDDNCLIAVPLTQGKLVLYEMKGVYGTD